MSNKGLLAKKKRKQNETKPVAAALAPVENLVELADTVQGHQSFVVVALVPFEMNPALEHNELEWLEQPYSVDLNLLAFHKLKFDIKFMSQINEINNQWNRYGHKTVNPILYCNVMTQIKTTGKRMNGGIVAVRMIWISKNGGIPIFIFVQRNDKHRNDHNNAMFTASPNDTKPFTNAAVEQQ